MNSYGEEMISKILFFLCLGCLCFSLQAGKALAQSGCAVVDQQSPILYIAYERLLERKDSPTGRQEIQLRLKNNSTCTIILGTDEEPARQTLEEMLSKKGEFLALQEGQQVRLRYSILFPNGLSQVFGSGDSVTGASLRGGKSVVFNVPLKPFQQGGELRLDYQYDWEIGHDAKEKYLILEHYIRFFSWFLPNSLRK